MKRNYDIYDRKLLVIIRALTKWRHYIQGTNYMTTVYSDHKNLTYFWSTQNLNQRQAQWSLLLSEYDIKLHHMLGIRMTQANALSRRSDHCPKDDCNNEDIVLLPDDLFVNLLDLELQNQILKGTVLDFNISNALEKLLNGNCLIWQMTWMTGKWRILKIRKQYSTREGTIFHGTLTSNHCEDVP